MKLSGFYMIKDAYFERMNDPNLKDNKEGNRPFAVYPKEKLQKVAKLIKDSAPDIANQKAFSSVEEMFADMDIML